MFGFSIQSRNKDFFFILKNRDTGLKCISNLGVVSHDHNLFDRTHETYCVTKRIERLKTISVDKLELIIDEGQINNERKAAEREKTDSFKNK